MYVYVTGSIYKDTCVCTYVRIAIYVRMYILATYYVGSLSKQYIDLTDLVLLFDLTDTYTYIASRG